MPSRFELPGDPVPPNPPKPGKGEIDTSKRYDVYCSEGSNRVAVYRNVLFRGEKELHPRTPFPGVVRRYCELEQPNGGSVFISEFHIIVFCEHGITLSREVVP